MPFLQRGAGQYLYYESDAWMEGWKEPQTVVLIHGFTESTPAWQPWVALLGRHYRVVRFDQMGFGRSSPVSSAGYSMSGFVDDAAAVVEQLAGGRAHVIGAKSGGLIAIALAGTRPDLVRSMTLASVPLDPPQPEKWMAHMEAHGVRSWARATMPPRLGSAMPPEGLEWWAELMGRTSMATARAYMKWVSSLDVAADLHKVRCPSLVLTTTTPRRSYSRSDIDVYREKLSHAEIVALAVDGYHVAASAPDAAAAATLEFLGRHRGG